MNNTSAIFSILMKFFECKKMIFWKYYRTSKLGKKYKFYNKFQKKSLQAWLSVNVKLFPIQKI